MKAPVNIFQKNSDRKRFFILVECSKGVMRSGKLIAQHFIRNDANYVLVQTYNPPAGQKENGRKIMGLLRKTAHSELKELKNNLVKQFKIPEKRIKTSIVEGDVQHLVHSTLKAYENSCVLLGIETDDKLNRSHFKGLIRHLIENNVSPVFVLSETITIIEKEDVFVIAKDKNNILPEYLDHLKIISKENKLNLQVITNENKQKLSMDKETYLYFSENSKKPDFSKSPVEKVLYEHIQSVNSII